MNTSSAESTLPAAPFPHAGEQLDKINAGFHRAYDSHEGA
jgi:hypothetical protein